MNVFEIIGGLVLFSVLSLFSFIILPSLFGCFGLVLFLFVFFALIIYFSASIAWFMIFALCCYAVLALIKYFKYQKLPGYDEYLLANPNAYYEGRVHCNNCGSGQILHVGLFGLQSKFRYYMCISCRKALYKFKVI